MVEFKLTQKQESFCVAYIETGNASEAYRRAYDATQMLPATVNRRAVDLMDDAKIVARLKELRQPAVENAQITLESHLAKLAELRDAALKKGDFGAAIRAEIARGRAAALYVEKVEVEHKMTLADLIEAAGERRKREGHGPWLGERGAQAERPSAADPCPATDRAVRGVTTPTATPNTQEA